MLGSRFSDTNEDVYVVFGGYTSDNSQQDTILYLGVDSNDSQWSEFVYEKVPLAGVIRGAIVNRIGSDGCDLMFAGSSNVYSCRDNFVWTSKMVLPGVPADRKSAPVVAIPFKGLCN